MSEGIEDLYQERQLAMAAEGRTDEEIRERMDGMLDNQNRFAWALGHPGQEDVVLRRVAS